MHEHIIETLIEFGINGMPYRSAGPKCWVRDCECGEALISKTDIPLHLRYKQMMDRGANIPKGAQEQPTKITMRRIHGKRDWLFNER